MEKLIAYCGLDCRICDARKATINNDDNLRKKVAEEWSKLNGVNITPEMINCDGCRVTGRKTPFCDSLCPIRQCALKMNKDFCGDCDFKSCNKIKMIIDNNEEAYKRLLKK